jgi:hypothetical protein
MPSFTQGQGFLLMKQAEEKNVVSVSKVTNSMDQKDCSLPRGVVEDKDIQLAYAMQSYTQGGAPDGFVVLH